MPAHSFNSAAWTSASGSSPRLPKVYTQIGVKGPNLVRFGESCVYTLEIKAKASQLTRSATS